MAFPIFKNMADSGKSWLEALAANVTELFSRMDTATVSCTEWLASSYSPTYVSATQFSLEGDHAALYPEGRMVRATLDGGLVYAGVDSSSYSGGSGLTTITLDGAVLDSTLSAVNLGILQAGADSAVPADVVRTTGVQVMDGPIRLTVLAVHPATPPAAGSIFEYSLLADGKAEKFVMDSDGNTIQITSGGDLMGSLDVQAVEVTIDSDGAQDWETKNVTITEVADPDNYSISFGRNAYANGIRDDVDGTGNFTIYDLRARLTSTTNLEVKYWDTLQTGSSIFPIFITAKLA